MKVICAPDSYKEALSAAKAAEAMARGVKRIFPTAEIDCCPIADGGEGLVDAMLAATGGRRKISSVIGPCGELVEAAWGIWGAWGVLGQSDGRDARPTNHTAVIEMAAAAGLALVPSRQRDPTKTTTYGVGQLILAALDTGAERIILGLGGSATTDGGCGAAQALGVRFYDEHGRALDQPISGGMLERIAGIDFDNRDARLAKCEVLVACDVTNPLTGPQGAAAVYGPQKGATDEQVQALDRGLAHLAEILKNDHGIDIATMPGSGAAGGLGGAAVGFLGGELRRGVEMVLEAVNFAERIRGCVLCLTGEGRLDGQSLSGKAVAGVARAAGSQGVATVALVGQLIGGHGAVRSAGLADAVVIGEGLSAAESMARTAELLEEAAAVAVRRWRIT